HVPPAQIMRRHRLMDLATVDGDVHVVVAAPAVHDEGHDMDPVRAEDRLAGQLRRWGSLLVAFSGGADSAFLLAAAVRWLEAARVVAATAVSPAVPRRDLDDARDFAAELGVRHLTPTTAELSSPGYVANGRDRCAFCKRELIDVLQPL